MGRESNMSRTTQLFSFRSNLSFDLSSSISSVNSLSMFIDRACTEIAYPRVPAMSVTGSMLLLDRLIPAAISISLSNRRFNHKKLF
jgi:hypothetical protein